jgi:hypothetical protein
VSATIISGDGGCTGFQWAERLFSGINACCVDHDMGGSDGALLDCLMAALPPWAWFFAGLSVSLMILLRPIYVWMQRRGWVK